MTAHYQIAQYQPRSTGNQKDHQRDGTKRAIAPQAMPELPKPFIQAGDCHWLLFHEDIKATLWYDRQCAQWNVRFDWPDIPEMKFDRDTPAMEMREKIIEAIDNRWSGDDLDRIPF